MFFTSEYECKLDAKGRLVLPAKIKTNLPEASGNEVVITRGFEPCLILYSMIEFKKIYAKVAGLSEFKEESRRIKRNFFRGSSTVELDSAGRFVIPRPMLNYAKLEKEAMVVGMGNKVEIWNPALYEQNLIQDPAEYSRLAEKYLDE